MLEFNDPQYLYLLLLVPLCIAIYILGLLRQRQQMKALGERNMLLSLMPGRSTMRQHIKMAILMLAMTFLIVALARPQHGLKQQTDEANGIEAVVMVDVSNSMLARDVQPTRLDRAKLLVATMVEKMKNDKIALGVFAGEAYPQMPITSDYASAKIFIDALSTNMVTLQGTNLSAAIDLGCKSFTQKKDVGKALILITDGENHEGSAEEAAQKAAKQGINIYVIGVGTTQGAEIPTVDGVLTDENGQLVHTALNEDMCRSVAKAGRGIYLHLDQSNSAQDELQGQIRQLKQSSSTLSYTARDEQFQAFALIALLLLVIEVCITETQSKLFKKFKIFNKWELHIPHAYCFCYYCS